MSDSSSEEEPLARRAARLPSQELLNDDPEVSDSENDDLDDDDDREEQEGTLTDDEQEEKEIEVVPFEPGEGSGDKNELKALILQDLKTEDPSQPGGYARRRVERGSVVLVRGQDDSGATVTWVAWVRKVYRQRSNLMVDVNWFYRKSDVPRGTKGASQLSAAPNQLVYTSDPHTVEAKFVRHPARAWFLRQGEAPPTMRCGSGEHRHTRPRPGFLVRYAYDAPRKRLFALRGDGLEKSPELQREVDALVRQSRGELLRLQREEEAYDAAHGLAGADAAPFVRPEPAATEVDRDSSDSEEGEEAEEEEEEEGERAQQRQQQAQQQQPEEQQQQQQERPPKGSSDGSSSDDDEPILAGAARSAAAMRAATPEAAQRGEALPAAAATPAQERLRRQQQQQAQQQQRAQEEADREAGELARLLPQAAEHQPAAQGAAAAGGEGPSQHSPPGAASKSWRRLAQQLVRKAGELPQKAAPSGQGGGALPRLPIERADASVAAGLRPALPAMAAVLRAVAGATEAACRELDQTHFLRCLVCWLWHLAGRLMDKAHGPEAAQVASCTELALQALRRCSYTGQVNSWLTMVRGVELLRLLAANSSSQFPAGIAAAARDLQKLWGRRHAELQAARKQRAAQQQQQRRQDRELLQQSPGAAKALSMATSGRRLSALGTSSRSMYVKPRLSPLPPGRDPSARAAAALAAAGAAQTGEPAQQGPRLTGQQQREPHQHAAGPSRPQGQQQERGQQQPPAAGPAGPAGGPLGSRPVLGNQLQQREQQQSQRTGPAAARQPSQAPGQQSSKEADALSQRWLSAFAGAPPGQQQQQQQPQRRPDVQRSATLPVRSASNQGKLAGATAAAPPQVARSASVRQGGGAAGAAALAGQKRPAEAPPPADPVGRGAKAVRREGKQEAAALAQPPKKAASKGSKLQAMLNQAKRRRGD